MTEKKYTKIFFRVFPMEKMVWDYVKILDDHRTIYIRCLQQLMKSEEHVIPTFWTFRTDQVFFNHSQEAIYTQVMPEVLNNVIQGVDAVIMAYGQTGTGKSLTMSGLYCPFQDRGFLPRIASDLFQSFKFKLPKNLLWCVEVAYLEFSKNSITDLLKQYPNHIDNCKHVTKIKVKTVKEALKIIFIGEGRKQFSNNPTYPSHSCSSIFTFYIYTKQAHLQDSVIKKSKLHVIDLVGSDTIGNFSCLFKNSAEVGAGNLAKTQLEQFFLALCSDIPERVKIKQRLNPMIQYLADSLRKTTILRLIGHIRVAKEDLLITISMLRFGEFIGGLKVTKHELKIAEVTQERVESLEKELTKLKLSTKYNNILMHQDLGKSLNEERFSHIERTVNEYLQNKIPQLTLLSVCDINIALEILKSICKKYEEQNKESGSVTKAKRLSSTSNKANLQKNGPRASRGSTKTSSSDKVSKKKVEEKLSERMRTASANEVLKTQSKNQVTPLMRETASKTRSKTSNSSLFKRSTARKRSSSSVSGRERSNETFLKPQVPPEYGEAWEAFIRERGDEYANTVDFYRKNEAAAKSAYKTYLDEIQKLRKISARVEKYKKDMFLVKMTREFQQLRSGEANITDYEQCVKQELEKSEMEQLEKQECVLKCQAEVKTRIEICKDLKKTLDDKFAAFCKEKFQTEVPTIDVAEDMKMNIEEVLNEVECVEEPVVVEDSEEEIFEKYKHLMENEKQKKKRYQMKHQEWLLY